MNPEPTTLYPSYVNPQAVRRQRTASEPSKAAVRRFGKVGSFARYPVPKWRIVWIRTHSCQTADVASLPPTFANFTTSARLNPIHSAYVRILFGLGKFRIRMATSLTAKKALRSLRIVLRFSPTVASKQNMARKDHYQSPSMAGYRSSRRQSKSGSSNDG